MTSIIILEGIPTSGKTAIIRKIEQILKSKNKTIEYVNGEEISNELLQKNELNKKISIKEEKRYLKKNLQKKILKKSDYILVHNFHLYQFIKNTKRGEKETLSQTYGEIEAMLEIYPTLIVYLEIENKNILPSFHKRFATYESRGKEDAFKLVLEEKGPPSSQHNYYHKMQNIYKEQLLKTKLHTYHLVIKKDTLYYDLAQKIVQKISELQRETNL